jgi:hypothetical protein
MQIKDENGEDDSHSMKAASVGEDVGHRRRLPAIIATFVVFPNATAFDHEKE